METVQQKQEVEHLKAVSSNVCQIIMNNMQQNAGSLRSKSDSFVNLGYSYKGAWLYKDHHYIMQKKKEGGLQQFVLKKQWVRGQTNLCSP